IGDFEISQDSQDPRVRLVMPPGNVDKGRMALSFGRQSLAYCEGVFGIPYPLPKLDLLAVPDFAFGAMENWGAITFRENLLLEDPDATSKAGRARICEVVAHEITHQWFGNLATPADWSFLWLNESFATYFGYGIVDHFHPEWGTWDRFLFGQTHTALDRDALLETFPMEIPGGEHVVINSSTAPLIYSKGASILRQIHAYIGEDRFRTGLRHYLDRFAYATADSSDFWAAFDAEADEPVSGIMKAWVGQKGFPLVTVRREGQRLVLTQKRFSYLAQEASTRWPIPVLMRCFYSDGSEDVRSMLFADGEMSVDVGDAVAWKLNDGQKGFYRVRCLDVDNRNALGRLARAGILSEPDRWGLQEDEFALVLSGALSLSDYLAFVRYLEKDTAYLPAAGLTRNLFRIFKAARPDRRQQIRSLASRICRHVLETIGFTPQPHEVHTIAALRDQLMWHGAVYGLEPVLTFTAEVFDDAISGGRVPPDILQGVLQAGALQGGSRAFGQLAGRLERSGSEHERLAILHAFGSLSDADGIRECFDYVVEKVPARNRFVPLVAMADNPFGAAILWEVFSESQDRLADFHPLLYERVLAGVITGCGVHKPHQVKPFFEAHLGATDKGGDVIRLSLERLDILLRLQGAV
ncbi:MAG: M1 family aminopeptidase, partial [Desulfobacterales bacterium]